MEREIHRLRTVKFEVCTGGKLQTSVFCPQLNHIQLNSYEIFILLQFSERLPIVRWVAF
ncbi:MAG: hypothetical protein ACI956_001379 [Nonlabens sp.]